MNYQHEYHAGGIADVFKHIVLLAILEALQKKENPFCYIDTHAGTALYDLTSEAAQKTGEYREGIAKLIGQSFSSALINRYLTIVANCQNPQAAKHKNQKNIKTGEIMQQPISPMQLQYYPGSPFIARACLRQQDRMLVMDYNPEIYRQLKQQFTNDSQVNVHHYDGYQAFKAFLPPKERRGCLLIDPPYENSQEFQNIIKILPFALQRWNAGIFAIWYPIKNRAQINRFHKQLLELLPANILATEFCPLPDDVTTRLNGSGVIIINPPWQIDALLKPCLNEVRQHLQQHPRAMSRIWWVKRTEPLT